MVRAEEDEPAQPRARARSQGKYEFCAQLDGGGQAVVFLALMRGQAGFSKLVVIKKLRAMSLDDPAQISMFLSEGRLAARLNHPNIVHTYEVGEDDGEYFIVMEYLEGQPMSRLAHNPIARKSFSPAMWARVASEALRGLGYAHNLTDYDGTPLDIVHRDISPDNLFLTYDGEVKVVDFGVAKALLNYDKTETGTLKGKVSYMAPEQVRGTVDRRADLFGMGTVLWEFLTGSKLFEGERAQVLYRLMTDPIPKLSTRLSDVDPWLASIVDRALAKDPDQRFQRAEEMREALEEFIRVSGDLVPDVQLGRVIREAFGETRQRVQQQVKAAMARVPGSAGGEPAFGPTATLSSLPEIVSVTPSRPVRSPMAGWPPSRARTISEPSDTAFDEPSALGPPAAADAPAVRAPTAAPRKRRAAVLITAGVAAAALVVTLLVARGEDPARVPAPTPPRVAPTEITSAPPPVAAPSHPIEPAASPGAVPAVRAATTPRDPADVAEPPAARPPRPAPPRSPPPRPAPPHVRTSGSTPRPKEPAPSTPATTGPRVKAIEDDPKRKIDVIND